MGAVGVSENSPFLQGSEEVELNEGNPETAPLLRPLCPQKPGGRCPADPRGKQSPGRSGPDGAAASGGQCLPLHLRGRWQLLPEALRLVENLRLPAGRGGARATREAAGGLSLSKACPACLPPPPPGAVAAGAGL